MLHQWKDSCRVHIGFFPGCKSLLSLQCFSTRVLDLLLLLSRCSLVNQHPSDPSVWRRACTPRVAWPVNSEKVPVPLELGFYICIYLLPILTPEADTFPWLILNFHQITFLFFFYTSTASWSLPSSHPAPPPLCACMFMLFFILNEGQYSLCFCLSDCYHDHCKFECLKILALTTFSFQLCVLCTFDSLFTR